MMLRRMNTALESIAGSLKSISEDIKYIRTQQENAVQEAAKAEERIPQRFMEIFSQAKKMLEGERHGN